MLKWLLTLIVAVFILGLALPHLAQRLKIGRLPGDVTVRLRGRNYYLPFASTLLLSLLLTLLVRLL
ncbi:MAG: DUF2905 domain-containing protein [Pseudomonadota bacterium]|jgi:hypothetical protein